MVEDITVREKEEEKRDKMGSGSHFLALIVLLLCLKVFCLEEGNDVYSFKIEMKLDSSHANHLLDPTFEDF